ncbi:MAG: methyltransferase domain-containing protein [Candidatus Micrarchaeia archaeon]|jgi:tRNA (adenine57-N1/adenine58-N1)-methyltransferase
MKNLEVRVPHILRKLRRGPSVMLPKDVGMIVSYTCLGKDSLVVDAGAGTGFNAIMLGRIAKKVVSYERREEFAKLAAENVKSLGMKNVKIKNADIIEGIEEKDLDLVTLDMPESEKVVPLAHAALKEGGYCVGYLPNIEQAKEFYMEAQKSFREVFMLENIVREYEVRDFGVRPKHVGLMHTAYLVFARK